MSDGVDSYHWFLTDVDGLVLDQERVNGTPFREAAARPDVRHLVLVSRDDPGDPSRHVIIRIPDDATATWKRTVATGLRLDGTGAYRQVTHVIGWQRTNGDRLCVYASDDGSVAVTDRDIDE